MATRRGKHVASAVGLVGVLALFGTVVVSWESLVQRYWLYRLEHGDREAKETAAERLGEMGCAAALSGMLELLRPEEGGSWWSLRDEPTYLLARKLVRGLGDRALPWLVAALESHDPALQIPALCLAGALGAQARAALPTLLRTCRSDHRDVHLQSKKVLVRLLEDQDMSLVLAMTQDQDLRYVALAKLKTQYAGLYQAEDAILADWRSGKPGYVERGDRRLSYFLSAEGIQIPDRESAETLLAGVEGAPAVHPR
jgi:hypothetical protein